MRITLASFVFFSGAFAQTDRSAALPTDRRIETYRKQVATQPDNLRAQNLLASALILKMRETTDPIYLERAARVLDGVLSREPSNYDALRLKNEVALENHDFRDVAKGSQALIEVAPKDPSNWGTLGDALMELGDYDGAATAYQRMVELRPDLSSYNRAAWYRYVTGDADGGIQFMQMAVRAGTATKENMAWCWVELGNLYLRTGHAAQALEAYSQARQFMPDYHSAWAGTGRALALHGDLKSAVEALKKAQAIVPMPDYAGTLHDVYLLLGNRAEAQRQLAMVDVVDRMDKAANQKGNRAVVYVYANHDYRLPRALELARTELAVRSDVFTWDALAWALFKNGKLDDAQEAMKKALAQGTPEAGFYFHAGMIAAAANRRGEAVKFLTKALELNPNFDLLLAEVAKAKLRELS